MRLPLRPCAYPSCGQLVERGYCAEHAKNTPARQYDQARSGDEAWHVYHSRRWQRLRLVVLARDPVCKVCGNEASTDADHIVPIREGGAKWDMTNLQGACHTCHNKKTRQESQRR